MKEQSIEIQKYEIDKKYELQQSKLDTAKSVKVGNESLASISFLAEKFAKAGDLVPKEFRDSPEKCFVAIYKGATLGLDAFTSLQRIAVINGRATIWGDTALALVRKSGLLEIFEEEINEENGKLIAICKVKRKGDTKAHIERFSQDDAVKAGLWGKNVWNTHPKRMLKYKARAFALRDIFADILDGLHLKEEIEDEQMTDVTPPKNQWAQIADAAKADMKETFDTLGSRREPKIVVPQVVIANLKSYEDLQNEMCEIDNLADFEAFEVDTKKDFAQLKRTTSDDYRKLMAMLESIKKELVENNIDRTINAQSGE